MKTIHVVGARPQFIKMAAVSRAVAEHNQKLGPGQQLRELIIHTGQHYDYELSKVFFEELHIPAPHYNLEVGSRSHGEQTGEMLIRLERVLEDERPDVVLVYGDTNTTLAGALAAAKLHISVAHVEAGLRSFNRQMPEEINRVLTDHVSDLLFAPTEVAVENLCQEGISEDRIYLVGDVMYDAALYYGAKAEAQSYILERLSLTPKRYILATVHRAGNTDDPGRLQAIFGGLGQVADEIPVVLPLHPRTQAALEREGMLDEMSRCIQLIEPVGYLDMLVLEKNAEFIVTDSGGVQKEAYFFKVPCITLRKETEWVELVRSEWNILIPPRNNWAVANGILGVLGHKKPQNISGIYGNGRAAVEIVEVLLQCQIKRR